MPFTLYDANLFVAYATPTDQSLIAIRCRLRFTHYALRHEFIRGSPLLQTSRHSLFAIRCRLRFTHYELRSGGVRYENPHRHASAQ
jgi:hypothetical protein